MSASSDYAYKKGYLDDEAIELGYNSALDYAECLIQQEYPNTSSDYVAILAKRTIHRAAFRSDSISRIVANRDFH